MSSQFFWFTGPKKIPRCWRFLFSPQTAAVLFLISFCGALGNCSQLPQDHKHSMGSSALCFPHEGVSHWVPPSPCKGGTGAAASAAHITETLWAQQCLSSFSINRFDECESIIKDVCLLGKCLSFNCLLIGKQLTPLIIKILSPEEMQPRVS